MPRRAQPAPAPTAQPDALKGALAGALTCAQAERLRRRHAYLLTHRDRTHEFAVLVWMRLRHGVGGPPDVEAAARVVARLRLPPDAPWSSVAAAVAAHRAGGGADQRR